MKADQSSVDIGECDDDEDEELGDGKHNLRYIVGIVR